MYKKSLSELECSSTAISFTALFKQHQENEDAIGVLQKEKDRLELQIQDLNRQQEQQQWQPQQQQQQQQQVSSSPQFPVVQQEWVLRRLRLHERSSSDLRYNKTNRLRFKVIL